MIVIFISTLIFMIFIIADLVPLYRNKQWKSFWTYAVLLLIAYVLHFLTELKVKIPSPAVPIEKIVTALFGVS